MTEQQWRVLRVLDEKGSADPTEIAREACLLLPSLTRILQFLEGEGLCSRSQHPTDKRRALIAITNRGRALLASNMSESKRIFAELEADFGVDRIEVLLDLLNDLSSPQSR